MNQLNFFTSSDHKKIYNQRQTRESFFEVGVRIFQKVSKIVASFFQVDQIGLPSSLNERH